MMGLDVVRFLGERSEVYFAEVIKMNNKSCSRSVANF